jgi:hypothetical protein
MAKVKVYVYKVASLFGADYKAFPPVVVLQQGDKFQLVNTVDDKDAVLSVPAGPFVGGKFTETVARKSASHEKDVAAGPVAVEYEVNIDGKKATAHSDPVIIIDG